jgi:hypothetical protein
MKHSRLKISSGAFELEINERGNECFEWIVFSDLEPQTLFLIFIGLTDTIDTGYGRDDDNISSREE